MDRSHLARAIGTALQRYGWTQTKLSDATSISQGNLNVILNRRRRPEPETLRSICTCWPDRGTNLRILVEHLRDEVELAGYPDGTISSRTSDEADVSALDHTLTLIRDADKDLYTRLASIIADIYRLLSEGGASSIARVAEGTGPQWGTTTKKRKETR